MRSGIEVTGEKIKDGADRQAGKRREEMHGKGINRRDEKREERQTETGRRVRGEGGGGG